MAHLEGCSGRTAGIGAGSNLDETGNGKKRSEGRACAGTAEGPVDKESREGAVGPCLRGIQSVPQSGEERGSLLGRGHGVHGWRAQ